MKVSPLSARTITGWAVLGLVLAAGVAAATSGAVEAACSKLPPAVPDRIGRVQLFINRIPDKAVLDGRYDIIWADKFSRPGWARRPGIYSMKYMAETRDPNPHRHDIAAPGDDGYTGSRNLQWYHRHHPDWVMYRCPGVPELPLCAQPATGNGPDNPAYMCFSAESADLVPLDITNPAVRDFLFAANLGSPPLAPRMPAFPAPGHAPVTYPSVLGSGLFDAVAVDNLGSINEFHACGVYRNGAFVRMYTGERRDARFTGDQVDWLNWLRRRVHAAGRCLAGNDYFHTQNPEGFLKIAQALDIVVDEHGFARNTGPLETGAAWLTRVTTLEGLIKAGKPLIIIDYVDPPASGNGREQAALSWSIANYLLIKGDRTYLALTSPNEGADPARAYPELFIVTGRPQEAMQSDGILYWRHFEHVLTIVNPSKFPGQLTIGDRKWRDLDGREYTGSVRLAAGSARVLGEVGP